MPRSTTTGTLLRFCAPGSTGAGWLPPLAWRSCSACSRARSGACVLPAPPSRVKPNPPSRACKGSRTFRSRPSPYRETIGDQRCAVVKPMTEVVLVGGERLRVEGDARQVEAAILSAARGSLMELAWMTEAETGPPIGINPDHVLMLRVLDAGAEPA